MKTRVLLLAAGLLFFVSTAFGMEDRHASQFHTARYSSDDSAAHSLDTLRVGVFVNKIYDVDYVDGSFKISFWIFANSWQRLYDLENYMTITRSISVTTGPMYRDSLEFVDGRRVYWTEMHVDAEIEKDFNDHSFPFDNDSLIMNILFDYSYAEQLPLILDTKNSSVNNIHIDNWIIYNTKIEGIRRDFNSSFGNPDREKSGTSYSGISTVVMMKRDSSNLFLKLFAGLFLSFLIAVCSFFLKTENIEAKLSLIIGGLFGVIGNKYIIEDLVPMNNVFTLSDKIHYLTLAFLLVMGIFNIIQYRREAKNNYRRDIIAFFLTLTGYVIIIYSLVRF